MVRVNVNVNLNVNGLYPLALKSLPAFIPRLFVCPTTKIPPHRSTENVGAMDGQTSLRRSEDPILDVRSSRDPILEALPGVVRESTEDPILEALPRIGSSRLFRGSPENRWSTSRSLDVLSRRFF